MGSVLVGGIDARVVQVLHSVTIADVLGELGVALSGPGTQQVQCPVHEGDRNPSARMYTETNSIYCFRCQKSWDVVGLVREVKHLPVTEAVEWLETTFHVRPDAAMLPHLVGKRMAEKRDPDLAPLVLQVEQRLREQRFVLGLPRYSKLLVALDLTVHQLKTSVISPIRARELLAQIWAAGGGRV